MFEGLKDYASDNWWFTVYVVPGGNGRRDASHATEAKAREAAETLARVQGVEVTVYRGEPIGSVKAHDKYEWKK